MKKNIRDIYNNEEPGTFIEKPSLSRMVYNFLYTIDDRIENVSLEITNGRIEFSADIKRGDNGQ